MSSNSTFRPNNTPSRTTDRQIFFEAQQGLGRGEFCRMFVKDPSSNHSPGVPTFPECAPHFFFFISSIPYTLTSLSVAHSEPSQKASPFHLYGDSKAKSDQTIVELMRVSNIRFIIETGVGPRILRVNSLTTIKFTIDVKGTEISINSVLFAYFLFEVVPV